MKKMRKRREEKPSRFVVSEDKQQDVRIQGTDSPAVMKTRQDVNSEGTAGRRSVITFATISVSCDRVLLGNTQLLLLVRLVVMLDYQRRRHGTRSEFTPPRRKRLRW